MRIDSPVFSEFQSLEIRVPCYYFMAVSQPSDIFKKNIYICEVLNCCLEKKRKKKIIEREREIRNKGQTVQQPPISYMSILTVF